MTRLVDDSSEALCHCLSQVNMPADSFESPLTLAACGGHTELAALLIERGANTEEMNDEGYTPLMEAVREGHEDVVTLLIHRGTTTCTLISHMLYSLLFILELLLQQFCFDGVMLKIFF